MRPLSGPVLAAAILVGAACGSSSSSSSSPASDPPALSGSQRDAGALADLQASARWSAPRCRWLQHGAHVETDAGEAALLQAARDAGLIELQDLGQGSAWRVTLTGAGKAQSATCGTSSRSSVWGVPVSTRKLIRLTHVGSPPEQYGRVIFEVEYDWQPTVVGARVKDVLTGTQAVEEGRYRTRVYLRHLSNHFDRGPNGWFVDAIDEIDAVRIAGPGAE